MLVNSFIYQYFKDVEQIDTFQAHSGFIPTIDFFIRKKCNLQLDLVNRSNSPLWNNRQGDNTKATLKMYTLYTVYSFRLGWGNIVVINSFNYIKYYEWNKLEASVIRGYINSSMYV